MTWNFQVFTFAALLRQNEHVTAPAPAKQLPLVIVFFCWRSSFKCSVGFHSSSYSAGVLLLQNTQSESLESNAWGHHCGDGSGDIINRAGSAVWVILGHVLMSLFKGRLTNWRQKRRPNDFSGVHCANMTFWNSHPTCFSCSDACKTHSQCLEVHQHVFIWQAAVINFPFCSQWAVYREQYVWYELLKD